MSHAQLMELEFERTIGEELAARGWLYENDGKPSDWNIELAMVPGDVLHWLSTQYPDEYEKAVPESLNDESRRLAEQRLLEHITKELAKVTRQDEHGHAVGGLLGVLRRGFNYAQTGRPAAKFGPMVVFPPANALLTEVVEASNDVRLRVLRQVRFDTKSNDTIDIVLTANGIPVVTMELKTDNTQTVGDAIRQYRQDRVPGKNRPLLAPGRVLVHFAVSNDLVFMTTKLDGAETTFLPFNQGHDGHQGNPPSETGSATNYLWRDILARPKFMRILKDFALWEPDRKSKKADGRLIFPRFHQLRAVERVVADVEANGPGGRYLIWHSAGSGKTKTIAWLSHRLIRHMDAQANSTFDSVIVVTDRTSLDENIREDMGLVQSSKGLVVAVGEKSGAKSPQLKKALLEGDHIVTCTLQTFPEVMKLIEDTAALRGRRWAVVADEAHSSQTGTAARDLKELLTDVEMEDDDEISADDLLMAKDSAIAKSANITFIALTATPKAKTLRLFGTETNGVWEAFDTYTMAQAIEEGFILDVLTNYSTYDMFLEVKTGLEEDPIVNTGEAVTNIVKFARLHPTSIAQKVKVVVEHFRRNVMPLLDGRAKAMVVTSTRLEAVQWSQKMNEYISDEGYTDMRTLVAFSGTVPLEGTDGVTEPGLNGRGDTANAFRTEDIYKVLIVANKFQTGFDEPLLLAMYVDKKLSSITTVQTLSRLNRIYPGKTAPMVVDFRNDPDSIQKAFKLYYSDAFVNKDVDPNALYTLADRLDTAGLYTTDEMREIAQAYLDNAGGEQLQKLCGPIKSQWAGQLHQAILKKDNAKRDELIAFRADLISYQHAWQFLSQIVDYQDLDLHRRAILATLLGRNLHLNLGEHDDDDYMAGVQLSGVQFVPGHINEDYGLTDGSKDGLDLPAFDGQHGGSDNAPPQGPLEEAIEAVNQRFKSKGSGVSTASIKGFMTAAWGTLLEDDSVVEMAKHNTVAQLEGSAEFSDAVDIALYKNRQDAQEIQDLLADPEFAEAVKGIVAAAIHAKLNSEAT